MEVRVHVVGVVIMGSHPRMAGALSGPYSTADPWWSEDIGETISYGAAPAITQHIA